MKLLFKIIDNRWFQRFVLPVAIVNTIISWRKVANEYNIFVKTINNNNDFFSAIATLGFVPRPKLYIFESVMPYQPNLQASDIADIANKTIIAVILQFVQDELLLGVVFVDCKLRENFVVTTIRPSSMKVLLSDLFDLLISVIITSVICVAYYFFFIV